VIQIIGVSELVLLEKGLASRKELRVRDDAGREYGVEVPESVIERLLSIMALSDGAVPMPTPKMKPELRAMPQPEVEPESDPGEVSFGGSSVASGPRVPRFVTDDDEDGKQI
jgi:hypothetical protein